MYLLNEFWIWDCRISAFRFNKECLKVAAEQVKLIFLFHFEQKCRKIVYNLCLVGGFEWSVWGWWIPGFWWSRSHLKSHLCGQLSPTLLRPVGNGLNTTLAVVNFPFSPSGAFILALSSSFGRWSPSKHCARQSTLRWPSIFLGLGQPLGRMPL